MHVIEHIVNDFSMHVLFFNVMFNQNITCDMLCPKPLHISYIVRYIMCLPTFPAFVHSFTLTMLSILNAHSMYTCQQTISHITMPDGVISNRGPLIITYFTIVCCLLH